MGWLSFYTIVHVRLHPHCIRVHVHTCTARRDSKTNTATWPSRAQYARHMLHTQHHHQYHAQALAREEEQGEEETGAGAAAAAAASYTELYDHSADTGTCMACNDTQSTTHTRNTQHTNTRT